MLRLRSSACSGRVVGRRDDLQNFWELKVSLVFEVSGVSLSGPEATSPSRR